MANGAVLSSVVAGPRQRRLAFAVVAISAIAFGAALPFARTPLAPVTAFVPAYGSALLVIQLITAVLLLGQFRQLRSAALLTLAAGFLFDGLMVIPRVLSFPGVISPDGWLDGSQTTAWIYMFWNGGFPLFVIAYAGLNRRSPWQLRADYGHWPAIGVACAVSAIAVLLTLFATDPHDLLPALVDGNFHAPVRIFVVATVWALTGAALLALLVNRPYTVLDLWLIVVMFSGLFDIALSAVFNAGQFDLGFYAGRLYGLLAASFVLAVLLAETNGLHIRLAAATARLRALARDLQRRVRRRTGELARANRQLTAILAASPVAILMVDPDGLVVLWTASAERCFGYTEAETLGRAPPYLTEPQMADFRANLVRAANDGSASGEYETQRRRKDGAVIDVSVRWARVNDEAGGRLGIMFAVADISERKKLESQLRQAQKMEAVGTLTGGMAHDFNNHLGVIILNLDVLGERVTGDPEADELIRDATAAAMRGADLIGRLLAFARRQPLQPQRTDINPLVTEITRLLDRTLGEEIKITLDLDDALWPTVVDPAQLESSLANLATNARDAMPNGGELTIATGNRQLDEDYAAQHAEVTPGDYAMIEVTDGGAGMSPEVLAQAFEPFFTTKPPGEGTGLGLSMVYGFIKQSGGHINVYSEVGGGTTVRLFLPRAYVGAPASQPAAPLAFAQGGGETVLAVEDNPGLRRVVVRQLTELGYRVLEAEDASAAIEVLERQTVAVLFTDVVLPGGTSGYELARAALARWPDIKILLTSGFPENRIASDGKPRHIKLLSKPYRREDIARAIREMLEEKTTA